MRNRKRLERGGAGGAGEVAILLQMEEKANEGRKGEERELDQIESVCPSRAGHLLAEF